MISQRDKKHASSLRSVLKLVICIVIIILRWEIAGRRRIATYVSYCSAVELSAVSVEMVDARVSFVIY